MKTHSKKLIKDKTYFDVKKFIRSATKGPHKRRDQRVISEMKQLTMPWWNDVKIHEQ